MNPFVVEELPRGGGGERANRQFGLGSNQRAVRGTWHRDVSLDESRAGSCRARVELDLQMPRDVASDHDSSLSGVKPVVVGGLVFVSALMPGKHAHHAGHIPGRLCMCNRRGAEKEHPRDCSPASPTVHPTPPVINLKCVKPSNGGSRGRRTKN